MAEDTPETEPEPALKKLAVFAGSWHGTGQFGTAATGLEHTGVASTETYEWWPGEHFLVGRCVLKFSGRLEALRVFGYDAGKGDFTVQAYDSMGFSRLYRGNGEGDRWHFAGESERVTITFGSNGRVMTTQWERLTDANRWLPLCETVAARAKQTS